MTEETPTPPSGPPEMTDQQLIEALGEDFVAYVSAAAPQRVAAYRNGKSLEESHFETIGRALGVARTLAMSRRPNASNEGPPPPSGMEWEPLSSAFRRFCAIDENGVTLAQRLRATAGGAIRELLDTDDEVLRALWWLARDMWPALLLTPDRFSRHSPLPIAAVYYHPAQTVLREALSEVREPLRQLFKDEVDQSPPQWLIMSTSGHGSTPQSTFLAGQFIHSVALRVGWPERHDEDEFFEYLEPALDQLRKLAKGRTADVPARIGLAGIKLPVGQAIHTELGTIHSAEAEPVFSAAGWPTPDVVVYAEFPLRYERVRIGDARPPSEASWEAWRTLDARVDKLRLAVLLAMGANGCLRFVTTEIFDPLFPNNAQGRFVPPLGASELTETAARDIQTWAQRIATHFDPRIALPIRRALSAADPTRQSEDALIDAMIALEALFGAGNTEVGFRLQLAVAYLLADSDWERELIFERIGDLYGARSELVHGAVGVGPKIHAMQRDALSLVLRCLRRLFTTHYELIASDARAKTIILTGPKKSSGE
jgi:hypothetical protein